MPNSFAILVGVDLPRDYRHNHREQRQSAKHHTRRTYRLPHKGDTRPKPWQVAQGISCWGSPGMSS